MRERRAVKRTRVLETDIPYINGLSLGASQNVRQMYPSQEPFNYPQVFYSVRLRGECR